jgi:anti-anti-sigma factor
MGNVSHGWRHDVSGSNWRGVFMNITQENVQGQAIVHLDGRFDFGARKDFKDAVEQATQGGAPIVLDLGKVTFVDSSALGLLVICHQNLKSKNIPFYLVNPQTYVKQVLDLANIGKMISLYPSLEDVPRVHPISTGASA